MTVKQKKVIIALRKYYKYLNARLRFIALDIIEVGDMEYNRLITSRGIYYQTFIDNPAFKYWLLRKTHNCRNQQEMTQADSAFYSVAERLKNEILESEK